MPTTPNEHITPETPSGAKRPRSALRRFARVATRVFVTAVALTLLVLVLLETDFVLDKTGRWAIARFNPFVNASLAVGNISGGAITGLDVRDLVLSDSSGQTLASVHRVTGRVGLLKLLSGQVSLKNLQIEKPGVRMSQAADSTWDLLGVLPVADTTGETTPVMVSGMRLTGGQATVTYYRPGRDSSLQVHDLSVVLSKLSTDPAAVAVDSVLMLFTPPGARDTVHVTLSGTYEDRTLDIGVLRLVSAVSDVDAHGRLVFTGKAADFEDLDFVLAADPFSFRDLYAFVPGLNPRATMRADLTARGTSALVEASANVELGDGSSVSFRGKASPPFASWLEYDLTMEARNVNPGYLIQQPGTSYSPITATLYADLSGATRNNLSGTARLDWKPFTFGSFEITGTRLDAEMEDGSVDLKADAGLNGALFSVHAGGRLLDDIPDYRADIDVRRLNIARFLSAPGYDSDVNGAVHIELQGAELESMRGTASVDITRSRLNAVSITAATATAAIRDGTLKAAILGSTENGRIDGVAELSLGETVAYSVPRFEFHHLDVAALMADTTSTSVSGSLRGSGEGLEARTAKGWLEINLDSTRFGNYDVRSGFGRALLANAKLTVDGDLSLRGGHVAIKGTARPFDRQPSYDILSAEFDSLDVAELTGATAWNTRLSGSLSGRAQIYDGRARGEIQARLDQSQINEQEIRGAEIHARVENSVLDFALDVLTPGGQFVFDGSGRPFGQVPEIEVSGGRFAGIDVSKFLGMPSLRTNLSGTFSGRVRGSEIESLVGSGRIDLDTSLVNLETVEAATVSVSADSGRYAVESEMRFGQGRASITGSGSALDRRFELHGRLADISPARLAGRDSLDSSVSLSISSSGRIHDSELSVMGEFNISESRVGGLVVNSALARFAVQGGSVDVDTLTLHSNVGQITGGGNLVVIADSAATDSDLSLHADVKDIRPISALLRSSSTMLADGSLDLFVTGPPDARRVRLEGDLRRISFADLRIGELRIRGVGRLDDGLKIRDAEGRLETTQPSLPNVAARTARLDAAFRGDTLRFEAVAVVDDRTDARTSGHLVLGRADPVLELQSLGFGPPRERWQLLTSSEITFGEEYRISNLLLYSEKQQVAVDGYVDLDGEQSLVVTIEELRLGALADVLGYRGLDGRVNGFIDLTGSADNPRIVASLSAKLMSGGKPVGDLSTELDYSDLRVQIDATLRDRDQRSLTMRGYVPVDLRLSTLDTQGSERAPRFGGETSAGETSLTIGAEGFAIDWIKPFLDPLVYSDIAGRLTGEVNVSGTFDQPRLDGSATITDGLLRLTEFDVTYRKIGVDARFVDDKIHLDHAEATSGPGSLVATGTISLDQLNLGDFNIDISTEDFLAVENREYRAVAAADLVLTGTTRRPNLEGTIDIAGADIYLTEEIEQFEPVKLSTQDLLTVEQRFGIRLTESDTTTFVFYEALSMNLTVKMSRNTWLRSKKNPTMDIQFTGSLDVSKKAFEDQQVFGSIEVLPERSKIVQFGRAFEIKKGDLTFNGPIDDPILDIEAEYGISAWRNPDAEVTITLAASGRLDDLDVKLTSDPAMELTDIVSYIALGRPASESLHLGGSGEGGSLATDIALGQVASLIEGVAGSGLGLDVVEIEQQGLDTRLTAGKYVTTRLYLSISQPLSLSGSTSGSTFGNKREITVEFEMLQNLLLRLLSRRGSISVNLLWQHAY